MANPVYFILGTPGSGRRAIVRDLIENGLGAGERAIVLVAASETAAPVDALLAALPQVEVRRWQWTPPALPALEFPENTTVFFLADAHASPIDQLEALKPWLEQNCVGLARIFCVVDCQLAEKQPILRQWFDACIHFADVVFLTRREGIANKWLSDFIAHFKSQYFPCHFVQVKTKGDLANPLVLLDPTARRMSQYFDPTDAVDLDVEIETDDEDAADDEEAEDVVPEEPYFVRQRSGRRERELPDITKFLAGE